jgi:hypothetical protein
MSFPAINPHRTVLRASVDGVNLHTQACAIGWGLRALNPFYSNFGRLLPLEAEIGRALWAFSARPAFSKIGGASCVV